MSETRPRPRLLLVEDDPISRDFLQDALCALPAEVDAAADIAQARDFVRSGEYDLWLVDAHLPDGDGLDCLRALRELAPTPALAITAGAAREELDALCAAGFLEVLLKPVSMAMLHATVRRLLGRGVSKVREPLARGKPPLWDEERALAALGGDPRVLDRLRVMFRVELPQVQAQLAQARSLEDLETVHALLHKLKASCGFVGAARLLQVVNQLAQSPADALAWQDFDAAVADALVSGQTQS